MSTVELGLYFMNEDRYLFKFEKIQMVVLGLIVPISMVVWVSYYLIAHDKSVFPGRSEYIWFHGYQAYLVACLWFGSSIALFGHNYLRFKRLKYIEIQRHICMLALL